MQEKDFISIIKSTLNSKYIGDDCAYLKDLYIVVTQDSLVEDVHFKLDYITPFQLGYKSVMVNLSDIAASGAKPKYLTVSLSLPKTIKPDFVKEFYEGAKKALGEEVEIVGGDITGADKVFISICAIGSTKNRKISSRKNAKPGYKVVVKGVHGSSAMGLKFLTEGKFTNEKFIKSHLEPYAQVTFGKELATVLTQDYAMMDTSDGLMDALSQIANESRVALDIDFDKIPHDKELETFENWQELVLFGGEDYAIVAAIPEEINCSGVKIGTVTAGSGINLKICDKIIKYSKEQVEQHIFNHF